MGDVLVITPTMGRRPGYFLRMREGLLAQAVSVRHVVVAPDSIDLPPLEGVERVPDPGRGLTAAVNAGLARADAEEFVYWLNDDDLVLPGGLDHLVAGLEGVPGAGAIVAGVRFIDGRDDPILELRAGRLSTLLLPWGPGLVASPGILLRRSALEAVGPLDEDLRHAADLEVLLRIQRRFGLASTRRVVGAFRWHSESLTVADATASLAEAESVRRSVALRRGRAAYLAYRAWRPLAGVATRTAKAWVGRGSRGAARQGTGGGR